jgi:hypothetical protein
MVVIAGVQALLPVGEGVSVGRGNLANPDAILGRPGSDVKAILILQPNKVTDVSMVPWVQGYGH